MPVAVSDASVLSARQVRQIRRPVNKYDKSTIVSAYPDKIVEKKETIFPGTFEIPAAPDNDFSILVIGPSSWFKEQEEGMPQLEIGNSSNQMAESVIRDFCNGLLGCDMAGKMPALFWIPGEFTKESIIKYTDENGTTFGQLLANAIARQRAWFAELVKLADVDWARTNGNPLSISRMARLAADKLTLTKPWMQDFKSVQMTNCMACGHLVNPLYPVCPNCKNRIDGSSVGSDVTTLFKEKK